MGVLEGQLGSDLTSPKQLQQSLTPRRGCIMKLPRMDDISHLGYKSA